MIKLSINLTKLDQTRARTGNTNKENKYLSLIVTKMPEPDSKGNDFAVSHSQTIAERVKRAKKIYVGTGKRMNLSIADEDPQKFFMLYVEDGGAPTTKHSALGTAIKEANRLAKMIGKMVYIMEVSGIVAAPEHAPQAEQKNDDDVQVSVNGKAHIEINKSVVVPAESIPLSGTIQASDSLSVMNVKPAIDAYGNEIYELPSSVPVTKTTATKQPRKRIPKANAHG